jgi:hypothetical protein
MNVMNINKLKIHATGCWQSGIAHGVATLKLNEFNFSVVRRRAQSEYRRPK